MYIVLILRNAAHTHIIIILDARQDRRVQFVQWLRANKRRSDETVRHIAAPVATIKRTTSKRCNTRDPTVYDIHLLFKLQCALYR